MEWNEKDICKTHGVGMVKLYDEDTGSFAECFMLLEYHPYAPHKWEMFFYLADENGDLREIISSSCTGMALSFFDGDPFREEILSFMKLKARINDEILQLTRDQAEAIRSFVALMEGTGEAPST